MRVKKISIEMIICSLTALFIILNCQSVWQNSTVTNYHIYEICFSLIILYCLYYPIKYGVNKKNMIYSIGISISYLIIIFLVVLFSVSKENMVRFLARYLSFPLFMICVASNAPDKKKLLIFSCFVNWASVIAWVSVVFWTLSTVGIIHSTGYITTGWSGTYQSYYGLYFSNNLQRLDFLLQYRRNLGLFTEGPMYMIVLVLAMLFAQIVNKYYHIKKYQIVGIIAALILVGSATGYIMLVFIVGIQLVYRFKEYRTRIFICMFAAMLSIVFGCIVIGMKSHTASFSIRMDDFFAGFYAWMRNPLFGNGYENSNSLKEFMSSNREGNYGFSNTIFAILAYGGVLLLIPYIIPLTIGEWYAYKMKNYKLMVLCVVYFILYFAVIFYTFYVNFIVWAFLFNLPFEYKNEKRYKMGFKYLICQT